MSEQGFTNKEIIEETGYNLRQIVSVFCKKGVKSNKYKKIDIENIEQLLIGSYLGDGSFTKKEKGGHSRLSLSHSLDQEEYFMYKFNRLKALDLVSTFQKVPYITEKGKLHISIRARTVPHPIFSRFRVEGYDNPDSYISLNLIKNIEVEGLAIWYLDDGSVCNDGLAINCASIPFEEKVSIKNLLYEKFDICLNVTEDTLYICKSEVDKFVSLIINFVPDSLKYKTIPYKLRAE